MPPTPEVPRKEPKPFNGFLAEMRRGALHQELSEKLASVVSGVLEHGKKGKLVLTIDIAPEKAEGMVRITDGVKVTVPESDRSVGLFYVDEDGGVFKTDPRQTELPLNTVQLKKAVGE